LLISDYKIDMDRLRGILFLAGGLVIGLIIGAVVLLSLPGGSARTRRTAPPSTGVALADFQLEGLNRKQVSLSSLRGKPVVLNFWATWCPPCREEMPLFERFSKELGDQVVFVGVNYAEDPVTVQNYILESKITFPIWLDIGGTVSELYYVQSYPNTFFVDEDGILRAQHIGQLNGELLIKYLATLGVTQ
jgi:cytochrome c biogenesis protein CcmG/thiol:disulfide interchange protein DsbE